MKMVEQKGEAACGNQLDIMRTYLYDAADKVNKSGKDAINSFADGDEQRMILMGLKRFTKAEPFNVKDARRRIADKMINEGKYCY
jgi:thymidine kinase